MAMMGNSSGPSVLQEGATEEKGEHARLASFVGAMAISDLVKSTLGPKGMDKILISMVRGTQLCAIRRRTAVLPFRFVIDTSSRRI